MVGPAAFLGSMNPAGPAQYSSQPSPPYTVASNSTFGSETLEWRPSKKQRLSLSIHDVFSGPKPLVTSTEAKTQINKISSPTATKSKRVRTGCLTCRERHLKCDEAVPNCLNCRKSSRECKRGVRLNFIDTQVKAPPLILQSNEWTVQFQDESKLIASEYRGGLMRYAGADQVLVAPPKLAESDPQLSTLADRTQKQVLEKQDAAIASITAERTRKKRTPFSHHVIPTTADFSGELPRYEEFFGITEAHVKSQDLADGTSRHPVQALSEEEYRRPGTHESQVVRFESIGIQVSKESPVSTPCSMATLTSRGPSSTRGGLDSRQASPPEGVLTPPQDASLGQGDGTGDEDGSEVLSKPEEVEYMQVFVEEVGPWMDSMDPFNHFSNIIPYRAARSPMLMNAFLSCGVRHLTLKHPEDTELEDKALIYYNTASTLLLRNLQNPDRDMVECATTACVLNVWEIMSERPTDRMSHIAGARALIKECGWSAQSRGIGAACFWLNIGMEVLSCLAFNWKCSWEPDQWGVDMNFGRMGCDENDDVPETNGSSTDFDEGGDDVRVAGAHGNEEAWVHRIFYTVGKIVNFRASIPKFQEASPRDEQLRLQSRFSDWTRLHNLCNKWNNHCPRTMKPYGYVGAKNGGKSKFPNVWLIKRPAVVGRLFYHTAQCILAQCNPIMSRDDPQSITKAMFHARQVCGIVAHSKDRGVASISIRSLVTTSACLTDREEQNEVLSILDRINRETGWRLGKVHDELKTAWKWYTVPTAHAPPPPRPPLLSTKQFLPSVGISSSSAHVRTALSDPVSSTAGDHSSCNTSMANIEQLQQPLLRTSNISSSLTQQSLENRVSSQISPSLAQNYSVYDARRPCNHLASPALSQQNSNDRIDQERAERQQQRQHQQQAAQVHHRQQQQIAAAAQQAHRQFFSAAPTLAIPTTVPPSPKMTIPVAVASAHELGTPSVATTASNVAVGSNPLAGADFSLPNHPYPQFYQPPTGRGFVGQRNFF